MYTSTKKAKCSESLKLASCVSNKKWSFGQPCSTWCPCWQVTHKSWWWPTNGLHIRNKLESLLNWIDKIATTPCLHPHPPIQARRQAEMPFHQAQAQAERVCLHNDLEQVEPWSWVITHWRVVDRSHSYSNLLRMSTLKVINALGWPPICKIS